MEKKNITFKIEIPNGMEIDKQNTDLEKGSIVFKKKEISYEDVKIGTSDATDYARIINKFASFRNLQFQKLWALAKLFNIVRYYNSKIFKDVNKGFSSSKEGYYIAYNADTRVFEVLPAKCYTGFTPLFYQKEDAESVVDNPNFKTILRDALYEEWVKNFML